MSFCVQSTTPQPVPFASQHMGQTANFLDTLSIFESTLKKYKKTIHINSIQFPRIKSPHHMFPVLPVERAAALPPALSDTFVSSKPRVENHNKHNCLSDRFSTELLRCVFSHQSFQGQHRTTNRRKGMEGRGEGLVCATNLLMDWDLDEKTTAFDLDQ